MSILTFPPIDFTASSFQVFLKKLERLYLFANDAMDMFKAFSYNYLQRGGLPCGQGHLVACYVETNMHSGFPSPFAVAALDYLSLLEKYRAEYQRRFPRQSNIPAPIVFFRAWSNKFFALDKESTEVCVFLEPKDIPRLEGQELSPADSPQSRADQPHIPLVFEAKCFPEGICFPEFPPFPPS